ncbi:MAG: nodulation protein NfeD [Gammaproteobacteria bacterium]|nr:nodulation protein NfeD [Gammaproteobacteria bacterium]MBU1723017.1 nodulation protein NfeD [Gammaproteobacteria bacterium]MBU2003818.1 nodulation protein NfeD [Gammaproteobacteria bacterium]
MHYCIRLIVLLGALLLLPLTALAEGKVLVIHVEGAIGPVTQDLIVRGIERAEAESASLVVLEMDTPGGLDTSMRNIISAILASRVPVATFVYPSGSRAASAGTYIIYASHIAAMAPATNLGSATPIQIGGLPGMPNPPQPEPENAQPKAEPPPDTMEKKVVNDAAAYIRGLAELRGRNAEWAEEAVREAVNLTGSEALKKDVIDLVATDLDDLLRQLNGREVETTAGKMLLTTANVAVERIEPDWRSELLGIITNPNIALILMMIGIYGLIIEFSNPGFILPGVTGAICLLLAMYAFQMLPVNYVGLALIIVGIGFMVTEFFVASGGVLGVGGLIAFVIGAVILFDDKYLAVSLPLFAGIALVAGGFLLWMLSRFTSLRHKPVVSGQEYLAGQMGKATEAFSGKGHVFVNGEYWAAHSASPVHAGQPVEVLGVHDMVLEVQAKEKS